MPAYDGMGSVRPSADQPALGSGARDAETRPLDPSIGECAAAIDSALRSLTRHALSGNVTALATLERLRRDLDARTWGAAVALRNAGLGDDDLGRIFDISPRACARRYGPAAQERRRPPWSA